MVYRTNAKGPRVSIQQVLEFLDGADELERKEIYARLESLRKERIEEAKEEFKVGDRVCFTTKRRRLGGTTTITGTIIQKRQKRFLIKPDNDTRNWTVQTDLVRKAF